MINNMQVYKTSNMNSTEGNAIYGNPQGTFFMEIKPGVIYINGPAIVTFREDGEVAINMKPEFRNKESHFILQNDSVKQEPTVAWVGDDSSIERVTDRFSDEEHLARKIAEYNSRAYWVSDGSRLEEEFIQRMKDRSFIENNDDNIGYGTD